MVSLSIPLIEDPEYMTFQIGMVSSEGVLLASDRKMTSLVGFRHGHLEPKIEFYEDEGFAHCSAGDSLCETFTGIVREELGKGARFVCDSLSDVLEKKQILIDCVYKARNAEAEFRRARSATLNRNPYPECVGGTTMLVFRQDGKVVLWVVDTAAQNPHPALVDSDSCRIAGDTNSPAVFLLNRYFPMLDSNINAFIPLAAHAVLMARCDVVDGLQIGMFTQNMFRTLTEEELKPFVKLSERLDSEIAERLKESPGAP